MVFTRKDDLDDDGITIEEFLEDVPTYMQQLLVACNRRYVAFNNRLKPKGEKNNKQVRMLLKIVDGLIKSNKGKYFSSKQYEEAEAKIKEDLKIQRQEIVEELRRKTAPMKQQIKEMQETINTLNEDNKEGKRNKEILQDKLRDLEERYEKETTKAKEKVKNRDDFRREYHNDNAKGTCTSCAIVAGSIGALVGAVGMAGSVGALAGAGAGFVVGGSLVKLFGG